MSRIENRSIYPELQLEMYRRGENYEKLGEVLNLTKSAVGRRMTGKVLWEIDEIRELCKHYGKKFEELFP